jgi:hypothetical protein
MLRVFTFKISLSLILLLLSVYSHAQNTVGTTLYNASAQSGYTLFAPIGSFQTYLVNNCGQKINSWTSNYNPGMSCFLMDDGSLLRAARINNPNISIGGLGGRLERYDWSGNLTWYYEYSTPFYSQHHDIELLPNGNILLLVVAVKDINDMRAVGRDTSISNETVLWTESIVEIQPVGLNSANVVWEWQVWDHLVQNFDSLKPNYADPTQHPERMNINYIGSSSSRDWLHANSISYNPTLDQIAIGFRTTNEIWIIDHSTSTVEAADTIGGIYGKGGDILYRWGQPAAYGASGPQQLFGQHDIHWIPDAMPGGGRLLCFNNGDITGISSADEWSPPIDSPGYYTQPLAGMPFGPLAPSWSYSDTLDPIFFSGRLSGAQRLPNGNTLICSGGNGYFVEVDSNKNKVWTYRNPALSTGITTQGATATLGTNSVFQCRRYMPDFIGFVGKDMTPDNPIELNFNLNLCLTAISNTEGAMTEVKIYPNPASDIISIESETLIYEYSIFNLLGQKLETRKIRPSLLFQIDVTQFAIGSYFLELNEKHSTKIIIK